MISPRLFPAFRHLSSAASSQPKTTFAEELNRFLLPRKVTEGFEDAKDTPIRFSFRNGADHFTLPLQKIVFTYCPHNGDSKPLMEYLSKNLTSFAKAHPTVEVVVSCNFNHRATVKAYYNGDFENKRAVYVGGGQKITAEHVANQVQRLRDSSGLRAKRFKMQVLSSTSSIRPLYSPFHFQNPLVKGPQRPKNN